MLIGYIKSLNREMIHMIGQMNFATAIAPLDNPIMAEFVENLHKINSIAEASDGFIWRLMDESGNATAIDVMTDPKSVLNVSVWRSVPDLYRFAYQSDHLHFIKNRAKWFVPTSRRAMALWVIEDGAPMPTVAEAFARLAHLEAHGPSDFAFDWAGAKTFAP